VKYGANMCLERLCATEDKFELELLDGTAPENDKVVSHILTEGADFAPVSQDLREHLSETLTMALEYGFNTNQLINKMLEVIKKNIPSPQ
jgi:hypothetical protein